MNPQEFLQQYLYYQNMTIADLQRELLVMKSLPGTREEAARIETHRRFYYGKLLEHYQDRLASMQENTEETSLRMQCYTCIIGILRASQSKQNPHAYVLLSAATFRDMTENEITIRFLEEARY